MTIRRGRSRRSSRGRAGILYDVSAWSISDFGVAPANPFGSTVPSPPAPVYPIDLKLYWKSSDWEHVQVGDDEPSFSDVPVVDAGGVVPGSGPSFEAPAFLNKTGTLAVKFTATKSSAEIVGEERIFGPIYASSAGLVANDGTNKVTFFTDWNAGDSVIAFVHIRNNQMRVGRV